MPGLLKAVHGYIRHFLHTFFATTRVSNLPALYSIGFVIWIQNNVNVRVAGFHKHVGTQQSQVEPTAAARAAGRRSWRHPSPMPKRRSATMCNAFYYSNELCSRLSAHVIYTLTYATLEPANYKEFSFPIHCCHTTLFAVPSLAEMFNYLTHVTSFVVLFWTETRCCQKLDTTSNMLDKWQRLSLIVSIGMAKVFL